MSLNETMTWIPASTKPDSAADVLCWRAAQQEWVRGWWDDEAGAWTNSFTGDIVLGVTHWAHVQGPQA